MKVASIFLSVAIAAILVLSACGAGTEMDSDASPTEPASAALPDIARVICEPDGTRVETPTVRPQADGVHLDLVNETGQNLTFSIDDPSGGGMGADAPQGTSARVVDLHPGSVSVSCYDAYTQDGSEVPRVPLDIVDDDGIWISTRLDCNTTFTGITDYVQGARGDADPLAVARNALDSYMQPGDVVERAGYPQGEIPHYRLLRDGDVLAVVELLDDGAGGWLESTVSGCSSLQD